MSSWTNAHKSYQKPHRERHQPDSRKHLGLLEKKKDYKKRADDYNAKKKELKYLQKRALDRNPDEYYYHMINSKVEDGEHHEKAKTIEYTPEQLQLMQTQDFKYIANRRVMEERKVAKLKSSLHHLDSSPTPLNKHTFFVDDSKELKEFNLINKLGTSKALIKRRYNRLPVSQLSQVKVINKSGKSRGEAVEDALRAKGKSYKLLEQREQRATKLLRLQAKMELKKALLDKKREIKQRFEPINREAAPTYEFKQERKR